MKNIIKTCRDGSYGSVSRNFETLVVSKTLLSEITSLTNEKARRRTHRRHRRLAMVNTMESPEDTRMEELFVPVKFI